MANQEQPAKRYPINIFEDDEQGQSRYFTCPVCEKEKLLENAKFVNGQAVCLSCSGRQTNTTHRYPNHTW